MLVINRCVWLWLAAVLGVGLATPQARALNLLPLGDSITVGWGWPNGSNTASSNGGYRYYLDGLLDPSFDFIGNRQLGTLSFDKDNWSQAGAKAQHDNGNGVASLLRAVHNITQGGAPADLRAFNPANGKADAVLLKIGTNSDLFSTTQVNNAYNEAYALMHGGAVNANGGSTYGNIGSATGLNAQLSNAAVANAGAHVFVAGILPCNYLNHSSTLNFMNHTAAYNYRLKNELLPSLAASSVNYHYVDMFSVRIGELNLAWLAGLFTGGNQASLIALLSPESDGAIDYVDWVRGGFDEAAWDDAQSNTQQFPGGTITVNTSLMPDNIHPNDLGYAVITNLWFNAMQATGLGGMGWLMGDANNDGVVDELDLITVEDQMGALAPTGTYLWGDANGDGRVDGDDFLAVEQHWGATWAGPPVPEPGSVAVLAIGAAGYRTARRQAS